MKSLNEIFNEIHNEIFNDLLSGINYIVIKLKSFR